MNNLLEWNTSQREDTDADYAFGLLVFLSLISEQQIAAGQIDANALRFMLGMILTKLLILNAPRDTLSR